MKNFKLNSIINIEQKPSVNSKFLEIIESYPCLLKVEFILTQRNVKISLLHDPSKEIFMMVTPFVRAISQINYEVFE